LKYDSFKGLIKKSNRGPIIATTDGVATSFALSTAEKFGPLFVKPGQ